MSFVVGIDFGTSNSAVSSLVEGKNQVLPDERGDRLTPSVIAFGKNQRILIGNDAKMQGMKNPSRTVHSIKRLIGRKAYSAEVQKAKILLPYPLVETEEQNIGIQIDENVYSPQDIAGLILKRMKAIAEGALGSEVRESVVTVPAYFNDAQRQATKEACHIAGLSVLRMINEPTAAALAYGFGKGLNETIAVYDLGGGTFDISILKLRDKVFEVVGTAGDTFLGGDDFDDRIIDIIAEDFKKKTDVELRKIPAALPILRVNAEKTKRRLSYAERSDIYIPGIVQKDGKALDLHFSLSREQFKEKTMDLIQRTFAVVDEALHAASIKTKDLDACILVGGPTKMPLIVEAAEAYFGQKAFSDLNPDEVVSIGASIQAQSLRKQASASAGSLLLDVTPLDLGIATVDGYVETLIEKNAPIPAEATKTFTTTKEEQKQVDLRVYQGKNRRVEDSVLLGEFQLSGFEALPKGQVAIDVSFSINTDGIVEVSAVDQATGVSQKVQVRLSAAVGEAQVQKSRERAEAFEQVAVKQDLESSKKVLVCIPASSKGKSSYQEGYLPSIDPSLTSFNLITDEKTKATTQIMRDKIGWIAEVSHFNNIPLVLKALTQKPQAKGIELCEATLTNDDKIYGSAEVGSETPEGFWLSLVSEDRAISGRVFVFKSKVKDVKKDA